MSIEKAKNFFIPEFNITENFKISKQKMNSWKILKFGEFDKILSFFHNKIVDAEVAEMEDALHSGCSGRKPVGVRLPSSALFKYTKKILTIIDSYIKIRLYERLLSDSWS